MTTSIYEIMKSHQRAYDHVIEAREVWMSDPTEEHLNTYLESRIRFKAIDLELIKEYKSLNNKVIECQKRRLGV